MTGYRLRIMFQAIDCRLLMHYISSVENNCNGRAASLLIQATCPDAVEAGFKPAPPRSSAYPKIFLPPHGRA